MANIHKIMLATDFSPHSRRALEHAIELASRLGVPMLILSAVQLPTYPVPDGVIMRGPDVLAELVERTRAGLDEAQRVALDRGVTEVEVLWVEGPPAPEIVRVAHEQSVNLIVVGTHGRGLLARAILGSVADRVVRSAHCPVLVVTHDQPH